MADVLNEIAERMQRDLAIKKRSVPEAALAKHIAKQRKPRGFCQALQKTKGVALIAELKQASPSAGVIRKENDLVGRIRAYAKGGASALSILTEEHYFHGSVDILKTAREESTLPLLRKDFIVDPYQIAESRALGADAVLLIVALLPGPLLGDFLKRVMAQGMDALVEVHDEPELQAALAVNAPLIGVNNRNLRTLQVDLRTSERLLPKLSGKGRTVVVESGIQKPEQVMQFQNLGAKAVLIGEALMRSDDPATAVREFAKATQ